MSNNKKALGKGLEELFSNSSITYDNFEEAVIKEEKGNTLEINISDIRANPYQPRKHFKEDALKELSESIKEFGVIQPIIVKKSVMGYELVAGERRTKAAKLAGLTKIPAIVKDFTDEQMMEIALLENIQREDLNPIEVATSVSNIIAMKGMTQEEFAKKFGKSRSYVTNLLGILRLPQTIQDKVKDGSLSLTQARNLSKIEDSELMNEIANRIANEKLTSADVERLMTKRKEYKPKKNIPTTMRIYEDALSDVIGNKVKIDGKKIQIYYDSNTDLNRIFELLNVDIKD